jgi:acyl-coenzyme A synthetase/AMP-(fatty) acid ligase
MLKHRHSNNRGRPSCSKLIPEAVTAAHNWNLLEADVVAAVAHHQWFMGPSEVSFAFHTLGGRDLGSRN